MTERDLQQAVYDLARLMGFHAYHPRWSIQSAAGYPDLTLVRPPRHPDEPGRIVWIELKRDGKRPTDAQQRWLDALAACGAEVYVFSPSSWMSGEIERCLR